MWTPDSTALLYTAADKKLYSYNVADGKTAVVASSDVGRIGSVAVSPDSKWIAFSKQDRTLRSHVYIVPDRWRRGTPRLRRQPALLRNKRRLDCGRPLSRVHVIRRRQQAASPRRAASTRRWRCGRCRCAIRIAIRPTATSITKRRGSPPKRPLDRTRVEAARPRCGAQIPEVRIDWNGLARRARQLSVPGTAIGGLTPAPEGHSVALTASTAGIGGGRGWHA